ncbi:hypothetical protein [Catellatospora sp. NPDC049133]|jgi:hypothetical protein|uniref:hypothetical protein n=1 Tax=Catellatospora sp. NPDC049133 TaxID=3155499 RepID=UPI00340C5D6C
MSADSTGLPDDYAAAVSAGGIVSEHIREATRNALAAVGVDQVPRDQYARIARSVAEADARRSDPDRRRQLDLRLAELTWRGR